MVDNGDTFQKITTTNATFVNTAVAVTAGETYRYTATLKGTGSVLLVWQQRGGAYTKYVQKTVVLTGTAQTVSFDSVIPSDGAPAQIGISDINTTETVYASNVSVASIGSPNDTTSPSVTQVNTTNYQNGMYRISVEFSEPLEPSISWALINGQSIGIKPTWNQSSTSFVLDGRFSSESQKPQTISIFAVDQQRNTSRTTKTLSYSDFQPTSTLIAAADESQLFETISVFNECEMLKKLYNDPCFPDTLSTNTGWRMKIFNESLLRTYDLQDPIKFANQTSFSWSRQRLMVGLWSNTTAQPNNVRFLYEFDQGPTGPAGQYKPGIRYLRPATSDQGYYNFLDYKSGVYAASFNHYVMRYFFGSNKTFKVRALAFIGNRFIAKSNYAIMTIASIQQQYCDMEYFPEYCQSLTQPVPPTPPTSDDTLGAPLPFGGADNEYDFIEGETLYSESREYSDGTFESTPFQPATTVISASGLQPKAAVSIVASCRSAITIMAEHQAIDHKLRAMKIRVLNDCNVPVLHSVTFTRVPGGEPKPPIPPTITNRLDKTIEYTSFSPNNEYRFLVNLVWGQKGATTVPGQLCGRTSGKLRFRACKPRLLPGDANLARYLTGKARTEGATGLLGDYQRAVCGAPEYRIPIFANAGTRLQKTQDVDAINGQTMCEAKGTLTPESSSMIDNSTASEFSKKMQYQNVAQELTRYEAIAAENTNPLIDIRIKVSEVGMVPFIERILTEFSIDATVTVARL
jgi:hypothetical protein